MERAAAFPSEEGDRWVRDALAAAQGTPLGRLPAWLARRLLYARLYLKPPRGVPVKRAQHLGNWLQDATCEFGENPWRLGVWAAAAVLVFAALHFMLDAFSPAPVSLAGAHGPAPLWDYLALSLQSFASMVFTRLEPASSLGAVLASVEALVGLGLLALFMYAMGRRMSGN